MENITEAIEQAHDDLMTTRHALREARELVASLEQDSKRIEIELVGLRSYAQRRGLDLPATSESDVPVEPTGARASGGKVVPISSSVVLPARDGPDLLLMSRNEAVATVMGRAPGPMDRSAIHEQCGLAGRDDSLDDISLSLSGLKRAGRAEKLGRGLWRMAEETPATGS